MRYVILAGCVAMIIAAFQAAQTSPLTSAGLAVSAAALGFASWRAWHRNSHGRRG
jgi:hypothetical protein